MIGYHYTLVKNLPSIMECGLLPQPLSDEDYASLGASFGPDFPIDGVHVFREILPPKRTFIIMAWLALGRDNYEICLLQVKYDEKDTQQGLGDDGDEVRFRSSFGDTDNGGAVAFLRFDLIFEPVPPENIKLLKTWNLLNYARI